MLADTGRDALHVAGDVAALHRQRSAITRHRTNGVFGDLLNAMRGHFTARSPANLLGNAIRSSSYFFVNHTLGRLDFAAMMQIARRRSHWAIGFAEGAQWGASRSEGG